MSGSHNKAPFPIRDVAALLPLTIRFCNEVYMNVDCFSCFPKNRKKGKMNINFRKDTFRCPVCECAGGSLALYAQYHHVSLAEAAREITDAYQINLAPNRVRKAPKPEPALEVPALSELADIQTRHQTYSMLLALLSLSHPNRDNLMSRGFTGSQIEALGYKSTPAFGNTQLAGKLLERGCTLKGVPGFYKKRDGAWTAAFQPNCSGILIPYRDLLGRIQAMQIRLDQPFDHSKYIWFSSTKYQDGTSSGSPVHFIGDPAAETIYITEGALKASAAHCLTGRTFVAVAGSGCLKELKPILEKLKKNGVRLAVEAFDMDKYTNEYVRRNLIKLVELIRSTGLDVRRLDWNPAYKGIDDFSLHLLQKNSK